MHAYIAFLLILFLTLVSVLWYLSQTRRLTPLKCLLLLGLFFCFHALLYIGFTVDDAFIAFRFARNWAEGLGPVYNAGERVEGYTSFAWVAALAAGHRLGLDIEATSKGLALLSSLVALWASWALSARVNGGNRWFALIAPGYLAVQALFAGWTGGGMEATLFAALLTTAALAAVADEPDKPGGDRSAWTAGLCALLAVTRPEGLMFAFLLFCAGTLQRVRAGRLAAWVGRWVLLFGAPVAAHLIFRYTYYGAWVPNTFTAKAPTGLLGSWREGLTYVYDFLRYTGVAVLGAVAYRCASGGTRRYYVPFSLVFAFLLYLVWVGGDVLHMRFFVHVLPLVAALFSAGITALVGRGITLLPPTQARRAIATGVAVFGLLCLWEDERYAASFVNWGPGYVVWHGTNEVCNYGRMGNWLAQNTPADTLIAAGDIGAIGYYSQRPLVDVCRLADRHLALLCREHQGDPALPQLQRDYVFGRNPAYLVMYAHRGASEGDLVVDFASHDSLWDDPRLRRDYHYHSFWEGVPRGVGSALFERNDRQTPPGPEHDLTVTFR